jgi:hypothetical protein
VDRVAAAALVVALVNQHPVMWPDLNRMTQRDIDDRLAGGVNWPWVLAVLQRKAGLLSQ